MIGISKLSAYKKDSIISVLRAATIIARAKKQGKRVGLCHGGFDLLHPGQVKHFESAKAACDILFVSVTSDRYVESRKGAGRPVFPDKLRAYMIASLRTVDYVVITDFKLGVDVINALKPSYYIKGPDFIGKQTPGITAEREAIAAIGGKMVYTNDPKLSTTKIIEYIQQNILSIRILVVIDRDGTLITNDEFLGRSEDWKDRLMLNVPVVSLLSYLKTKYKTTYIVCTNQGGVARGYFSEERVREIHDYLTPLLKKQGVTIDSWQYAPTVDRTYAAAHPEYKIARRFVETKTKRKPSTKMVDDALKELKISPNDFAALLVLGDREEDRGLAKNLRAHFVDVRKKTYEELVDSVKCLDRKIEG